MGDARETRRQTARTEKRADREFRKDGARTGFAFVRTGDRRPRAVGNASCVWLGHLGRGMPFLRRRAQGRGAWRAAWGTAAVTEAWRRLGGGLQEQESRAGPLRTPSPRARKKTARSRGTRGRPRARLHSFRGARFTKQSPRACQLPLKGQSGQGLRKCPLNFTTWSWLVRLQRSELPNRRTYRL